MKWQKARKRPVLVDVWGPWDGTMEQAQEVLPADWVRMKDDGSVDAKIRTAHGFSRLQAGGYLVRTSRGAVYPIRPDVFAEMYEALESGPSGKQMESKPLPEQRGNAAQGE